MKTKQLIRNTVTRVTMLLALMLLTATAWADDVPNYNVTLHPGEGTGDAIVLNSQENYFGTSDNGGNVPKGQFFLMTSDNNNLWFKAPDCPDTFTPPEGKQFDCWDLYLSYPGNIIPITSDCTLLTAQWKDAEQQAEATITIPNAIQVAYGDTETAFDILVESVTFNSDNGELGIHLYDGSFTCSEHEGTIPFTMTCNGNNAGRGINARGWFGQFKLFPELEFPYTCQGFINISSNDLAAALPGTYTAALRYITCWLN